MRAPWGSARRAAGGAWRREIREWPAETGATGGTVCGLQEEMAAEMRAENGAEAGVEAAVEGHGVSAGRALLTTLPLLPTCMLPSVRPPPVRTLFRSHLTSPASPPTRAPGNINRMFKGKYTTTVFDMSHWCTHQLTSSPAHQLTGSPAHRPTGTSSPRAPLMSAPSLALQEHQWPPPLGLPLH